jgi:predicted acyl esterase
MRIIVSSSLVIAALALATLPAAAQVYFQRKDMAIVHGWMPGDLPQHDLSGQQTYTNAAWRRKMLIQFPQADLNHDGVLTEAEAIQYHMSQARMFSIDGHELDLMPPGSSHQTVRVPMRDGKSLPTELYFPAGSGPWPVVLVRTSRGRIDSALDFGNELLRRGFAFVGQDLTPEGDFVPADQLGRIKEGNREPTREWRAAYNARQSQRNAGEDGYDTIEWIAKQPWSNGKIGMTGYSEASFQTKAAMALNPPHLSAVISEIGTISFRQESLRGGAGMGGGNTAPALPAKWSPPGSPDAAPQRRGFFTPGPGALVTAAPNLNIFYNDRDGWFDMFTEGAVREWQALAPNGKSILIMGNGDHGPLDKTARLTPAFGDCDLLFHEIAEFDYLKGVPDPAGLTSRMYYFLMGDAVDPSAPGNVWKVTTVWPPPNAPTSYYFTAKDSLSVKPPKAASGERTYVYNPKDPVNTLSTSNGKPDLRSPFDQRPLDARADILHFDSEQLAAPLEISGRPSVELYVSTDVPDTAFTVTLLDIYPDGYEWPIRSAGFMLRSRDGQENPQPAKPGEIYKITLPMVDTALTVNTGHRLGVRVSSSSFPRFEVHPNTWDAIDSYDKSVVAHNSVHISRDHASRLILPVVAPGVSKDYVPPQVAAK